MDLSIFLCACIPYGFMTECVCVSVCAVLFYFSLCVVVVVVKDLCYSLYVCTYVCPVSVCVCV